MHDVFDSREICHSVFAMRADAVYLQASLEPVSETERRDFFLLVYTGRILSLYGRTPRTKVR